MPGTKTPFQSLTINAALVALAVQLLALFGIEIAPETAMEIGTSLSSLISAVAMLVAIYGRWRARKAIVATKDDAAVVRSGGFAAIGALLLAVMLLGGCAPRQGVASASASAGTVRVAAPDAVRIAATALFGLDARTEAAISDGTLSGPAAVTARGRVSRVRAALLIALKVSETDGLPAARGCIGTTLDLAATAYAALLTLTAR